ncbi:hypothetical protein ACU4GD_00855 [Cupriavidus basilensis]
MRRRIAITKAHRRTTRSPRPATTGISATIATPTRARSASTAVPDSKDGKGNIKLPDLDCAVCHFASAQLVLPDLGATALHHGVAISYRALAASYLSAPGATPDRPQWSLAV